MNLSRFLRLAKWYLLPKSERKLSIGKRDLILEHADYHERQYYVNQMNIDSLIAGRFIRPGDIVLDAGANIGFTTLHYINNGASHVYAFEPAPDVYRRLALLEDGHIHTYNMALSNKVGEEVLFISRRHQHGHSLNQDWLHLFPSVYGKRPHTCVVKVTTVDSTFRDMRFDFMKLDVEGSELGLLKGAERTLSSFPPRIVQIEMYPPYFDSVHEEMSKHFRYVKRAVIDLKSSSLLLIAVDKILNLSHYSYSIDPPVYIYANESDML